MNIKLFDLVDGEIKPSVHCYTIAALRNVIDEYGPNAGKVFACLHYMHSLNPEDSPYAYTEEEGKWKKVNFAVAPELELDVENNDILKDAFAESKKLYETTTYKVFSAFKGIMDKLVVSLGTVNVDLTKDSGNMLQIKQAIATYGEIKKAYNESFEAFIKSFGTTHVLGGGKAAYDAELDDDIDDE